MDKSPEKKTKRKNGSNHSSTRGRWRRFRRRRFRKPFFWVRYVILIRKVGYSTSTLYGVQPILVDRFLVSWWNNGSVQWDMTDNYISASKMSFATALTWQRKLRQYYAGQQVEVTLIRTDDNRLGYY